MIITFYWQGLSEKQIYGHWDDGLRAAMRLIEKEHTVYYREPWEPVGEGTEIILYWEALCTYAGKDRDNFQKVRTNPLPKILLFAGGPIRKEWCDGFDLFLVESQLNEFEFTDIGKPWLRAFGVNTDKMKPEKQPKVFDAVFPSTCAGWKRQGLFSRSLKSTGVICGRFQENDSIGFMNAREAGTLVLPELPYEAVNSLYNASHTCVNTSDYWGGGQRTTLEAMAAGIPVVVMRDSVKNCEYVEESGAGLVVDPTEGAIRAAVNDIKENWTPEQKAKGRSYVESKWSHHHYKDAIIKGINQVLKR